MNILFIFVLYEYPIRFILVGGLEHECYFSIYWEFHNPN